VCGLGFNATRLHFAFDAFWPDLVQLVDSDERRRVKRFRHSAPCQHGREELAMIHPDREISETKFGQRLGYRATDLRLNHRRG
jgi:hypothetical protein